MCAYDIHKHQTLHYTCEAIKGSLHQTNLHFSICPMHVDIHCVKMKYWFMLQQWICEVCTIMSAHCYLVTFFIVLCRIIRGLFITKFVNLCYEPVCGKNIIVMECLKHFRLAVFVFWGCPSHLSVHLSNFTEKAVSNM